MSRTANLKPPPFSDFLGLKITHVSPERAEGELVVRAEHDNSDGILHGGAIMSLADTLGGAATMANLPAGAPTVGSAVPGPVLRPSHARTPA